MQTDEHYYMAIKKDETWVIRKYDKETSDLEEEYEVSEMGTCTCKGYEYRGECKHVRWIMEKDSPDIHLSNDEALECKKHVYDEMNFKNGTLRFDEYLRHDDGSIHTLKFRVHTDKVLDYEEWFGFLPSKDELPIDDGVFVRWRVA